jgi:hypothetical protein
LLGLCGVAWLARKSAREDDVFAIVTPDAIGLDVARIVGTGQRLALASGAAIPLQNALGGIEDLEETIVSKVTDIVSLRELQIGSGESADRILAVGRNLTHNPATWSAIQLHSKEHPATLTITGYRNGNVAVSESHIAFTTSTDPVGAPIFYRDVPLMPTANTDGTVQPLAPDAIHLINWRLRDIRNPESHTVLTNMPTCLNCHSFSADGKTMGIDVDGPNEADANLANLSVGIPLDNLLALDRDMSLQRNDGVKTFVVKSTSTTLPVAR